MRYGKKPSYPLLLGIAACGFAVNAALLATRNSPISFISLGLAGALLLGARWLSAKSQSRRNGSV